MNNINNSSETNNNLGKNPGQKRDSADRGTQSAPQEGRESMQNASSRGAADQSQSARKGNSDQADADYADKEEQDDLELSADVDAEEEEDEEVETEGTERSDLGFQGKTGTENRDSAAI